MITSDRRVNWQGNIGIVGGIPSRTTIYQTIPAGASATTVQNALNSCPANQVVLLSAGAYSWGGSDIDFAGVNPGVVLRGAGPALTIITRGNGQFYMRPSGISESALSNDANLSVDAVKGGSTLTLSSVPAWVTVGGMVGIDQLDDPAIVLKAGTEGGSSYRDLTGNGARGLAQLNRVVAKTATTITLEIPLYYGFKVSQTAQIYQPFIDPSTRTFRTGNGIEDLKIICTTTLSDNHQIKMECCDSCWIKNVEIENIAGGAHVFTTASYRCEIRHCYFHGSNTQAAGQGYGVALYHFSCGFLIEDNIFRVLHNAMTVNYGSSGNVFGYNYEAAGTSDSGQNPGMNTHGTHCYMNLWEGNYCEDKVLADWTHGSSSHNTIYRCRVTGGNSNANNPDKKTCVSIEYYNRYWNIVGNVLGTNGLQNKYVTDSSSQTSGTQGSILKIGGEVNINDDYSPSDANSYTTGSFVLVHGNWDYVKDVISYDANVSDHTLIDSLYLSSKPAIFGSLTWPAFDPASPALAAVTGIPAGYRYVNGIDPGGVVVPPVGTAPIAPSGLQATPN